MSVPVINLFAGAGGLAVGARSAGGDVRLLVDIDRRAAETLESNWAEAGAVVELADVSKLSGHDLRRRAGLERTDPLIIVGGPPCQPFSKANYWTESGADAAYRRARGRGLSAERPAPLSSPRNDDRVSLVDAFLRRLEEARPDGFAFENVVSITHPRNRSFFDSFVRALEDLRFKTRVVRASALDYGVPQKRERIFVLGARSARPGSPAPTHARTLEAYAAAEGALEPPAAAGPAIRRYADPAFFEPEEVVRGRWEEHLREIPPGWNYKALTAWAGHPNPSFVAETRYWHFLLKLHPDRPSWTIPASPGPWVGPFHWDSRRLRTPELAALQTFPDDYRFSGSRRDRVRQIGNAVPALMGAAMVSEVMKVVARKIPSSPSNPVPASRCAA